MTFLLIALLAAAAGAVVLLPFLHGSGTGGADRASANVQAYRDRQREIAADLAAGALEPEAAAAVREELDRRLLEDAAMAPPASAGAGAQRARLPWLLGALLLPLAGVVLYAATGSWRTAHAIELAQTDPRAALEAMTGVWSDALARDPADAQLWATLGLAYATLERTAEAAQAYGRANAASNQTVPDWLVAEGETLAVAAQRDLSGRPAELFDAALVLDAEHTRALWYAGLAALQRGDLPVAIRRWERLLQNDPPADVRTALEERLVQMRAEAGLPAGAASAGEAAPAASVQVRVNLAPALAGQLPEGATLFVFAKAASGPPMPLAVHRRAAGTFPVEVTLDDSMAMTPQLRMSQFDAWVITARISMSGQPVAASGDLEGSAPAAPGTTSAVDVLIDRRVP